MEHRHAQFLSHEDTLLLVIDIQDKLFATMSEAGQSNLLANVPILLQAAKELEIPAIVTEQYPKGIGPTIPVIAEHCQNLPTLDKVVFAATEVPEIESAIAAAGRRQIVLTGMETHICVYQTALGLLELGYDVHVVADACATRNPFNHEMGLKLMHGAGACVTSSEAVFFQWLERAGTPSFKKLQKLIV